MFGLIPWVRQWPKKSIQIWNVGLLVACGLLVLSFGCKGTNDTRVGESVVGTVVGDDHVTSSLRALTDLEDLRGLFNQDSSFARLVPLISPT